MLVYYMVHILNLESFMSIILLKPKSTLLK